MKYRGMQNNKAQLQRMFWNYSHPKFWSKIQRMRKRRCKIDRIKGLDCFIRVNNEYD